MSDPTDNGPAIEHDGGFERVVIPAGEIERREIGSGETLRNALFDVSAEGARLRIVAEGADWAIRNVGVRGVYTGDKGDARFRLAVEAGSSGRFENVYLGDGATDGGHAGVFVPTVHAGHLEIDRCNVQGWPDNGIYASAPGRRERNGEEGTVEIENSYAAGNNIAGFRVGTDGSSIRNSVVRVDGPVPANELGKRNARGIWAKEGGDVTIENCELLLAHSHASFCVRQSDGEGAEGVARVRNSELEAHGGAKGRVRGRVELEAVGHDPNPTPPAGVPLSAEKAASGGD